MDQFIFSYMYISRHNRPTTYTGDCDVDYICREREGEGEGEKATTDSLPSPEG